jgi:hypothetical protein
MKNIKSYTEFNNTNEGVKDFAIGAAALATTILPSFGKDKTSKQSIPVKSEIRKDVYLKDGYMLDSITIDTIYKEILIKSPETNIYNNVLYLNDVSYGSGIFKLNKNQEDTINNFIAEIANESLILKVFIESSTDKTPIGNKLKLSGIKDNYDLSKRRNDEVKEFLIDVGINSDSIEQKIFSEEGGINNPKYRRVAINVVSIEKVDLKYINFDVIDKITKTYHLSKDIETSEPVFKKNFKKKKYKINTVENIQNRKAIKCSKLID